MTATQIVLCIALVLVIGIALPLQHGHRMLLILALIGLAVLTLFGYASQTYLARF